MRVLPPDRTIGRSAGSTPPPLQPPPRRTSIPPAILIGAFALVAIVSLLYGYSLGTREGEPPEPTETVASDPPDTAPSIAREQAPTPFPATETGFVRAPPGHEVPEGAVEYLNRNVVSSLAVDPDGFVWTAGPGGVVRWDPDTGTGEPQTLPDGTGPIGAIDIAAGPDGDVWVTTARGVSHWNGEIWLTDGVMSRSGPGSYMGEVAAAPDGSVWAVSGRWPTAADDQETHLLHRAEEAFAGGVPSFVVDRPVDQLITANGSLWALIGGDVWRLGGDGWVQELDAPEGFITSIAFEPNGRAWVTVGDRGVMVWDGVGLAEVSGGGRDVLIPEGQDGEVRTVALDGGLVPWALVIWWDTTGQVTEELVRMDDQARFELPLSGPQSTGRMVANDDGLWIGTAEGLLRFNGMAWRTLRIRDELPLWAANSAAVDEAGNLWMADGFSVVRWNGETARTFSVEELHWFGSPAARFAQTWVAGAPGGPLWAGAGCQASVLRDESWLPVVPPPGAGYCWEGRAVGADGSLWLLDYGESGPRLDRFVGEEATTVALPEHDVYALAVASDGTLWAAGTAVSRLTDDGWVTELDGVDATTIAVAADDTVWVGERCWDCPEGAGSNLWHLADGTWTRVSTQAVIAMAMAGDGTGWTLIEGPDGRTRLWRDAGGGGGIRPYLAIGSYAVLAADDDGGVWAASEGRLLHITP